MEHPEKDSSPAGMPAGQRRQIPQGQIPSDTIEPITQVERWLEAERIGSNVIPKEPMRLRNLCGIAG